MLHSDSTQYLRHQPISGPVEWGKNNFKIIRRRGHELPAHGLSQHRAHVFFVHLRTDNGEQPSGGRFLQVDELNIIEDIDARHLPGHLLGMLRRHLRPIRPVRLVTVEFFGVVAGGNVDARDGTGLPDGKRQLRGRSQILEKIHVDSVGHQYGRRFAGEGPGIVPAVVGDGHAVSDALSAVPNDVGECLSGMAHRVHVHAVQAGLHHASQSRRTELQHGGEPALDFLRIPLDFP